MQKYTFLRMGTTEKKSDRIYSSLYITLKNIIETKVTVRYLNGTEYIQYEFCKIKKKLNKLFEWIVRKNSLIISLNSVKNVTKKNVLLLHWWVKNKQEFLNIFSVEILKL